jgi:hypothetical protein
MSLMSWFPEYFMLRVGIWSRNAHAKRIVMTQIKPRGSQLGSTPMGRLARPASLLFAAALLCSCSSRLDRVDGRVVDAGENNAPLANATVVAVWERDVFALVESRFVCEDLQLTHSDEKGQFHFDRRSTAPAGLFWGRVFPPQRWVTLTVYKRGFASEHGGPSVPVNDQYKGIIRLKKLDQSFEYQTNYMLDVSRGIPCVGGDFHRLQRPLLQQLEADAAALATTPEQLQYVNKVFYFGALELFPKSLAPQPIVIIGRSPMAPQPSAAAH